MKLKRDPIHVDDDEWMVASDWMKERYEPRMPEQGADYNAFLIRVAGCQQFKDLLPHCKADIFIPGRKLFTGMTLFDLIALQMMFDFLHVKKDRHVYRAVPEHTKCRFQKPSSWPFKASQVISGS